MRRGAPPRVGVFGIGLAAYWPQFDGLRERLAGYQQQIEARLEALGAEVVSAGLVDTAQAARQAGETLAAARVDLVMLYTATYATSSQVLPVVQAVEAPVVILNLQPTRTFDYEAMTTGEWLANCSACCVPEIAGAFTRARIPYRTVTGTLLDGDPTWDVLREWLDATYAVRSLRTARFGFLGHTYPGMLDMYSDLTQVHAQTGAHVELLEIDDLVERVESADAEAVERKGEEVRRTFDLADAGVDPIAAEITAEIFEWSARVAVGLDRLVDDFELDGLTYYYRGIGGNAAERVAAGLIVGNSLLTARGVPASGEGDLKTNIGMLLLDRLGAGGSYTEFYALDFDDEFVLMGHDGPAHLAIAEGRPVARALKLYHGKAGAGLSIEMKVRLGPVTILGVTQTADGRLKLVAAEGESISGPTFRIGNTNSRIRFGSGPTAFFDAWCAEGPTHHVALGVGHQSSRVRKVADLLGLELAVVGRELGAG
jgi:L-arabinose isomerase